MYQPSCPPPAVRRFGNVAVLVGLCALPLFGIAALAIDGGLLQDRRQQVQAAADASALAAAREIFDTYFNLDPWDNGLDPTGKATKRARAIAKINGYIHGSEACKVIVNIPPKSGPFKGEKGHVEVIIESHQKRFFSTIFGSDDIPIRARSVARGTFDPKAIGILVLHPTAQGALTVSGGAQGIVSGAAVVVNSSHTWAGYGEGTTAKLTANIFQFHGGVNPSGLNQFDGNIFVGFNPVPDPYRDLPQPNPADQPVRYVDQPPNLVIDLGSGVREYYLQPGLYPGGLSFDGKSSVFLAPGLYYMEGNSSGGGFRFKGNSATKLVAEGVMLFNDRGTNTVTDPGKDQYPAINISGQASVKWSPMTDGIYKNFSFFQAREQDMIVSISGQGGYDITGVFYTPDALLDVSGSGDSIIGSQYISSKVNMRGNGTYRVIWDAGRIPPVRDYRLVE